MDNTDGIGQTFIELSEINNLKFVLERELLPIHEISYKVADFLGLNVLDVALGGGADFQLLGTINKNTEIDDIKENISDEVMIIGKTDKGGGVWIKEKTGESFEHNISGWDYYSSMIEL